MFLAGILCYVYLSWRTRGTGLPTQPKCGRAILRHAATVQVLEEVGYEVKVEDLKPVTMYVSAVGISGTKHFMFYTAVDESMRSNGGGGLEYVSL